MPGIDARRALLSTAFVLSIYAILRFLRSVQLSVPTLSQQRASRLPVTSHRKQRLSLTKSLLVEDDPCVADATLSMCVASDDDEADGNEQEQAASVVNIVTSREPRAFRTAADKARMLDDRRVELQRAHATLLRTLPRWRDGTSHSTIDRLRAEPGTAALCRCLSAPAWRGDERTAEPRDGSVRRAWVATMQRAEPQFDSGGGGDVLGNRTLHALAWRTMQATVRVRARCAAARIRAPLLVNSHARATNAGAHLHPREAAVCHAAAPACLAPGLWCADSLAPYIGHRRALAAAALRCTCAVYCSPPLFLCRRTLLPPCC